MRPTGKSFRFGSRVRACRGGVVDSSTLSLLGRGMVPLCFAGVLGICVVRGEPVMGFYGRRYKVLCVLLRFKECYSPAPKPPI